MMWREMTRPSRRSAFMLTATLLLVSTVAFGWGGASHSMLANNIFSDAAISPFVAEFGIDRNAVTSWESEPPDDWHHPGWSMVKARGYIGTYNGKNWAGLDETTRLRYLTHILFDACVPVTHSPAGWVYSHTVNEGILEMQAAGWSSTPNMSGQSYSGTLGQVRQTFENECVANAQAYKSTQGFLDMHSTDDNRHYGWDGQELGLKLARAVLTDYFLAKRNTVAQAGNALHVNVGGSATFSSAGSYDPDSITWNANATYSNNGGGIASVSWDLNNDGTYETAGSSVTRSHSQLVSTVGYTEGKLVRVKVVDDEGKVAYDTTTISVYSNPEVTADAAYKTLKQNQVLKLKGSGSDADGGGIIKWEWDIDGDGQFDDATTATASISYETLQSMGMTAGNTYTIAARATDNDGVNAGQATDSFTLTMDTDFNIASQAAVTGSSTYSDWAASGINDGSFEYNSAGTWVSDATGPHWITLQWTDAILFNAVTLYSIGHANPTFDPDYNTDSFEIQIWNGSEWVTIDVVAGNDESVYTFFSETTYSTDALRIYITDANDMDAYARLLEVEVTNGAPIPEPMTLGLLALGGAIGLARRRKN